MLSFCIALAWAGPTIPPAPPEVPAKIIQASQASSEAPLADRMAAISATLLGLPYVNDPMGEGEGYDSDPFVRYDAFDCLTFTEEVVALSMATDPSEAGPIRLSLRYGSATPAYETRRHFMELQWVPGVIADGWMRDTTAEYGRTILMEKEVTASTWSHWGPRKDFAMTDEQLPVGTMRLTVLPLDEALAAVDSIRPGSIILTVRVDRPGVPLWITHVGFVVPTEGPATVRHATKMSGGGIKDHQLKWYLEHLKTYKHWPVAGISILEPIDPR